MPPDKFVEDKIGSYFVFHVWNDSIQCYISYIFSRLFIFPLFTWIDLLSRQGAQRLDYLR